jgi:poly(hydroxyalkanoate) granule-associated protein
MPKKLKALAGGDKSQIATAIRDSASQIWLAGLGAFAKAQKEGGKLFEALVKEGEVVQKQAKKSAEDALADVKSSALKSWDQLEHVFEDRVARALHTLNVPTKKDIDTLSHRVAELTAVTKKLAAPKEPSHPHHS